MSTVTLPAASPSTSHHPGAALTDEVRKPWTVLVLLALAQFMVILDITVVNVALPSIGASLNFTASSLQWVVTAYVLFTGGLLLLGGRAADLLGRRHVFLAGLGIFTLASLASGLAPSAGTLIVSRAAQGVGAALLTPAALSIIVTTYTGAQRTAALGAWGVIGSAGAAAGLVLGGMLTTWLGWEWVFLINVPVGIVVAILTTRFVKPSSPSPSWSAELDLPGALTLMAGLFALVYAIAGAAERGWGTPTTLGLLAASAVLLAAFSSIEHRAQKPLVPAETWQNRPLTLSALVMLAATGILIGTFFLNSIYLQNALGASAIESGFSFLPLAVAIGVAAHLTAHLLGHAGSRVVAAAGLILMAIGTLVFVLAPDEASYVSDLLPGLILVGFGAGFVFPAVSVTSMDRVAHERSGLASGLMSTAHEVGAALGVAVLAAVASTAGVAGSGFASGYEDGFLAASVFAGTLAVVALIVFPVVRPVPGARVGMH
jgi:EmrB/QacA subfamily drug resistance transporter